MFLSWTLQNYPLPKDKLIEMKDVERIPRYETHHVGRWTSFRRSQKFKWGSVYGMACGLASLLSHLIL
jgi:hypothetical protein